ncbi:phosphohistidine phosphatase SixA [Bowmanella denitrificans]|uniref:Phosphohistidine phosphatase SixA n=1 Tax=Bowmanella denitrificans TaxID=366582 RepID=A0ABN0WYE6_9ALTE|nr:phosphohistidine phosphatase SixA [Bowmanella denitrificans]
MQIFVMRHGEAESRFVEDASRNLTDYGVAEAKGSGGWLKEVAGHIDLVLVSPYARAIQTLDAVKTMLPVEVTEICNDVTPNGQAEHFHAYLQALLASRPTVQRVLIVSHMPFVSALVDELSGHFYSMLFATAGIAVLDYEPENGRASLVRQHIP